MTDKPSNESKRIPGGDPFHEISDYQIPGMTYVNQPGWLARSLDKAKAEAGITDVPKQTPSTMKGWAKWFKHELEQGSLDEAVDWFITRYDVEPEYRQHYMHMHGCDVTSKQDGFEIGRSHVEPQLVAPPPLDPLIERLTAFADQFESMKLSSLKEISADVREAVRRLKLHD